jgi:hypothetical protein
MASQYSEIPDAVARNATLRDRALHLIGREPIAGKATDGGTRLDDLRTLLAGVFKGEISATAACSEVERILPRGQSMHLSSNRVFPDGWGQRLVRTQVSRFYNQAVLELAIEANEETVFVPHSSEEEGASPCTQLLAGGHHNCRELLSRLTRAYSDGAFTMRDAKVPHHPHCTHVVKRV